MVIETTGDSGVVEIGSLRWWREPPRHQRVHRAVADNCSIEINESQATLRIHKKIFPRLMNVQVADISLFKSGNDVVNLTVGFGDSVRLRQLVQAGTIPGELQNKVIDAKSAQEREMTGGG